ncbi:flagellar basal body rod protein FlgG [Effusibacillus dendaii]|uniref:Flagellar hook protein FlgE n=1 Tax=Effusibacillus dendaii TaxID=2743772 RepID=A0A7I8D5C6_9BACL|nr:flagellar basal body rod protein FlgG [Effusibacillus dendaii]BCJ85267.1 flagellar basal-body rod protein FlgG [Effusibacillus dendaii]
MLRSMYSGISGMRGFQTKLDVIGNNIANVNTVGFKAGRVMFKDILSQTVGGATAPGGGAGLGGINPKQIGLGSATASIDTLQTPGSAQTTNVPTDAMINGDGFFVVTDGASDFYTRDGNFKIDAAGNLVLASNGMRVKGVTTQLPATAQSFSIDSLGNVKYVDNTGTTQSMGQMEIAKFQNPGGLMKVGDNLYVPTNNSGSAGNNPLITTAGQNGAGQLIVGALEMSNVDLTNEFTEMIVAQRGFQANSRIITTSDEILQEVVNLKR